MIATRTFPVLFTTKVMLNGLKAMVFLDIINQPCEMVHVSALPSTFITINAQVLVVSCICKL